MRPEIQILGLPVQTFGLCFALAFTAAGLLLARRLREIGWPPGLATELVAAALVGGLVGARLYWLVEHWGTAGDELLGSLFGGAGLTWYGGALGGALAVGLWAKHRGRLTRGLLGAAAPALALGYAIGRIGCQLAGDGDYGRPSDVPWAMAYPNGVVPTDERVHPTPVYEALWMGLVALLLWRLRDRLPPLVLFGLYLVLAGTERFVIELWRQNPTGALGLTTAQAISGLVVIGGAVIVARAARVRAPVA